MAEPEVVKKMKSKKEIIEADPETLSIEDLGRRKAFIELEATEANLELTRHQNAQFKMKQQEIKDKYKSRGRELNKTFRDQEIQQAHCSHRKAGRGAEALINGGNSSDYAVIKHLLPTNSWYVRCLRCGKTWAPPFEEAFDMATKEGRDAFEAAKKEYQTALAFPTDNISSTGITFQYRSDDANISANKFVHEVMKDVNLR